MNSVVTRGRHYGVSTVGLYSSLSRPLIRYAENLACWALGRMHMVDWKAFEEEHSGTYVTREQLRELYGRAVSEPLWVLILQAPSR